MSKDEIKKDTTIWHTPNFQFSKPRTEDLSTVVISHTVSGDVEDALAFWSKTGYSVNMFIRKDGTTLLYYGGDLVTFMCGNGIWYGHGRGGDGIPLNEITFNIMLVGNGCKKQFEEVQMESLTKVLHSLKDIYGPLDVQGLGDVYPHPFIKDGVVKGGGHVAPGLFDWEYLARQGYGKYVSLGTEDKTEDQTLCKFGDTGMENIQKALNSIGYDVQLTGVYDQQTSEVIRGFLNHYRHGAGNKQDSNGNYGMVNDLFTTSGAVVLDVLTQGNFNPLYSGETFNQPLWNDLYDSSALIDLSHSNLAGDTATTDTTLENAA